MTMQPMTPEEQEAHEADVLHVKAALAALRLTLLEDEDVQVAEARLENWLTENDGRWVK